MKQYYHHKDYPHGEGKAIHGDHHGHGYGKGRNHDHHEHAGRNKGGAFGPSGFCVCVKCGYQSEHKTGIKCTTLKCPECGHVMARKELIDKKKKSK